MAQASNAAFMSEVEDDRRSVASAATSIWDGAQDQPLVLLRDSRKGVNVLRRQLIAEHARVKTLNEVDFDDEFVEVDTLCYKFGSEIIRHVNLARKVAKDYPENPEFVLGRVANSVNVFREAWNKTSYFGQVSYVDKRYPEASRQLCSWREASPRRPYAFDDRDGDRWRSGGAACVIYSGAE